MSLTGSSQVLTPTSLPKVSRRTEVFKNKNVEKCHILGTSHPQTIQRKEFEKSPFSHTRSNKIVTERQQARGLVPAE